MKIKLNQNESYILEVQEEMKVEEAISLAKRILGICKASYTEIANTHKINRYGKFSSIMNDKEIATKIYNLYIKDINKALEIAKGYVPDITKDNLKSIKYRIKGKWKLN